MLRSYPVKPNVFEHCPCPIGPGVTTAEAQGHTLEAAIVTLSSKVVPKLGSMQTACISDEQMPNASGDVTSLISDSGALEITVCCLLVCWMSSVSFWLHKEASSEPEGAEFLRNCSKVRECSGVRPRRSVVA